MALSLPKRAWRTVAWLEGPNVKLRSRFVRVRVRAVPIPGEPRFKEETLLIEWPKGEATPTKYWLTTVNPDMSLRCLVDLAKMRWCVERDYEDLRQEIGLGHYEGRGWPGFPHHGTLAIAAYGFLISERQTIPPQDHIAPLQSKISPCQYGPEASPIRPQGHVPNSIATIRRELTAAIANRFSNTDRIRAVGRKILLKWTAAILGQRS